MANRTREAHEETLSIADHQGHASQNQRGSASGREDGGDQANRTAGAGERDGNCGPSVSCAEACGKQFCSFSKGKQGLAVRPRGSTWGYLPKSIESRPSSQQQSSH